jgi:hypothetical protein
MHYHDRHEYLWVNPKEQTPVKWDPNTILTAAANVEVVYTKAICGGTRWGRPVE